MLIHRRVSGDRGGRALTRCRARGAGSNGHDTPHSLRATGITIYMENGGTLENAQAIAAHESPRTTKLYDRTSDTLSLDERIAL